MAPMLSVLHELPLFEDLSSHDLARIAPAFAARTYARGDQLLGDGGRTESFLLSRGAVRLVRTAPDGRVLGLGLLAEGAIFGYLPFAQVKAEERAEALAESRVLHVQTRDLERIAQGCPPVAAKLLAEVGVRLGDASERLVGVAFQSVPARLASILLELADRYGRVTPRGVRIDLRLTHGQLAELVPTTRETLTKVAGWLRGEGIASFGRNELWIDDLPGLEQVVRGERQMPGRGVRSVAA